MFDSLIIILVIVCYYVIFILMEYSTQTSLLSSLWQMGQDPVTFVDREPVPSHFRPRCPAREQYYIISCGHRWDTSVFLLSHSLAYDCGKWGSGWCPHWVAQSACHDIVVILMQKPGNQDEAWLLFFMHFHLFVLGKRSPRANLIIYKRTTHKKSVESSLVLHLSIEVLG